MHALTPVRQLSGLLSIACLLSALAHASGGGPTEVRFAPGASQAEVSGAVVRGTREVYSIVARKGQWAQLELRSAESNAVFTLWRPGARLGALPDDDVQGRSLPDAGDGDDATRWQGPLPDSGRYLVVVGTTRGNATYTLSVAIGERASPQVSPPK